MSSHGFAPIEPYDHRAWLWVASLTSPVYSVLILAARIASKWELLHHDDSVLGVGYVFAFIHWGLLYSALSEGLGLAGDLMSSSSQRQTALTYFVSRIFLLISLGCSKASALLFTRRIFTSNLFRESFAFNSALASIVIWTVLAVLLSSAGCQPSQALKPERNGFCTAIGPRWKVLTALDVVTEVLIVVLPTFFIMKNTIQRSKKVIVVFVYSFRLVVAAFSIVTMTTYLRYLDSGLESIGLVPTIAWQEVLLGSSLISASIPCLRAFIWAFMSRGTGGRQYGIVTSISMGGFGGASVLGAGLRSLVKSQSSLQKDAQISNSASTLGRLRPEFIGYKQPEDTGYEASISAGRDPRWKSNKRGESSNRPVAKDSQEHIIGIARTVDFEIQQG